MTDNEINRAVAEELGWKPHDKSDNHWVRPDGSFVVPTFHCDYNAAAEMRRAIKQEEQTEFRNTLCLIVFEDNGDKHRSVFFDFINSTPRQQAEAFLRMRGKWKEVEK
jgi:hypothetical protein